MMPVMQHAKPAEIVSDVIDRNRGYVIRWHRFHKL
jgi:hypothetical protein